MVFTIQSQYIDSVGKLRIIYGFYKKQLINLLTFPLPPLAKVVNNPYNKVQSFPGKIKIDDFVEHLKNELNCDEVIHTSAGYWFKNSTFPPSGPFHRTEISFHCERRERLCWDRKYIGISYINQKLTFFNW